MTIVFAPGQEVRLQESLVPIGARPKFALLSRTSFILDVQHVPSHLTTREMLVTLGYYPVYFPSTEAGLRNLVQDKSVICATLFLAHAGGGMLQLHDGKYVGKFTVEGWLNNANKPPFKFLYVGGCNSWGFFRDVDVAECGIGTTEITSSGSVNHWWKEFLWQYVTYGGNIAEVFERTSIVESAEGRDEFMLVGGYSCSQTLNIGG